MSYIEKKGMGLVDASTVDPPLGWRGKTKKKRVKAKEGEGS